MSSPCFLIGRSWIRWQMVLRSQMLSGCLTCVIDLVDPFVLHVLRSRTGTAVRGVGNYCTMYTRQLILRQETNIGLAKVRVGCVSKRNTSMFWRIKTGPGESHMGRHPIIATKLRGLDANYQRSTISRNFILFRQCTYIRRRSLCLCRIPTSLPPRRPLWPDHLILSWLEPRQQLQWRA